MLLRIFDWISQIIVSLLVLVIVLVALLVSLGRYYAPMVEHNSDWIIERLNELTGLQLSVRGLEGEWNRLSPVFTIKQLALLKDDGTASLVIPMVKIAPDLIGSLKSRSLRLSALRLRGVRVSLAQSDDGRWHLDGFAARPGGQSSQSTDALLDFLLNFLLDIGSLEISDSEFHFSFSNGREASLQSLNIILTGSGGFHRLVVSSTTEQQDAGLLMVIEGEGDPRRASISGKAYIKLNQLDVATYSAFLPLAFDVRHMRLSGELWFSAAADSALTMQGSLSSPDIDLRDLEGGSLWSAQSFSGDFLLERNAGGRWQGWIPQLSALEKVPVNSTYFSIQPKDDGRVIQLHSRGLTVGPLVQIALASGRLPAKLANVIETLNPAGDLSDIRLRLPLGNLPDEQFELSANLHDVSLSAWQGAPGARHVNGAVVAGVHGGRVDLDTPELALHFPTVYEHWLAFSHSTAQVSWSLDEDLIEVQSGLITLDGKDGDGNARGLLKLELPRRKNNGYLPSMSLQIGLRDSKAEHRWKYLPHFLSEGLLSWLDSSILQGDIPAAGFVFRGPLTKSSRDKAIVQLVVDVHDAKLKYHPDWPLLDDIDALVEFDDHVADIAITRASLFDSPLQATRVQVVPPSEGPSEEHQLDLLIQGGVTGNTGDGLQVIKESPIRQQIGGFIDNWQASGAMQVELDLSIPLEPHSLRPPLIDVKVALDNSTLQMPDLQLQIDEVRGPLLFDSQQGLHSAGLDGQLWQQPLSIRVDSEKQQQGWHSEVSFQSRIDARRLLDWSKQPAVAFFSGRTHFAGKVVIDPAEKNYVEIESALRGVVIDLPAPFAKPAAAARQLYYRQELTQDRLITLTLADQLAMQFVARDDAIAGQIDIQTVLSKVAADQTTSRFKFVSPDELVSNKILVSGHVADFILEDWLPAFERYNAVSEKLVSRKGAAAADTLTLQASGIRLDRLEAFGRQVTFATVGLDQLSHYWRVHLYSDELAGDIDIPVEPKTPYRVDLDYLHTSGLVPVDPYLAGILEGPPVPTQGFNPGSIPAVDVRLRNVTINQEDFGHWDFSLRPIDDGVRVEQLNADFKRITIVGREPNPTAQLVWKRVADQNDPTRQIDWSYFDGRIQANNIGDVLESWGYERMMDSRSSRFDITADWPGTPFDIGMQQMNGRVTLAMTDGHFINTPNTAKNALKVVGFLNLDRIVRRLKLDFADLAAEGLGYDKISGAMNSSNGIVKTVETIQVEGSSSTFRIDGTVDFPQRTLDGYMVVILPIADNLPWIAAVVAGGLPVAAGVYVASKVLKKQVDNLSSAVYRISGGWDNPEVKFDRLFGSSSNPGTTMTETTTKEVASSAGSSTGSSTNSSTNKAADHKKTSVLPPVNDAR